jgi:paraquat-inducible protein A
MTTAAAASLARCPGCEKLHPLADAPREGDWRCWLCGATIFLRRPGSLSRTWALLLSAALLYVPANLLPVMTVSRLGDRESDTIMSGIVALFEAGWYPVAILIFFASIMVPGLKIVGLTILLVSVQRRSRANPRQRTVMYRAIEYVGRWSMLDMFTTSLLVALVQLGEVATIQAGLGATCFGSVVILTMLAAASFDSRILWDRIEEST